MCLLVGVVVLDHTDAIRYIERIVIFTQSHIGLFQSPGSNQRVDFFTFNRIQFTDSRLDLTLVGFDIDNKDEGVAVFNEFHTRFGRERVFNNREFVQSVLSGDTALGIFGFASQDLRAGSVEVHFGVNAGALFRDAFFQGGADGLCFLYDNNKK
jgi:hypothetical protein